jgi:nucleoside permease NupC
MLVLLQIKWQTIIWGVILQILIGYFVLRLNIGQIIFRTLAEHVNKFLAYTDRGTEFIYGTRFRLNQLFNNNQILGFIVKPPNICGMDPVFAFKVYNNIIIYQIIQFSSN